MTKKLSLQEVLFEYGDFWSSKEGIALAQQREQEMLRASEQLTDEFQHQFSDWKLEQRTDHGDVTFVLQKSTKSANSHKLFSDKEMFWKIVVSVYQMANGSITVESWIYLVEYPEKKVYEEKLRVLSLKLPWREEYVSKLFAVLKGSFEQAKQDAVVGGKITNEGFNMVGDHEQSQSLGPDFNKLQMWGNGQSNLYQPPGSIQHRLFNPNSNPENLEGDEDFPYMREGVHAVSGPVNTEDTWGKDVIHSEDEYELMPEAFMPDPGSNQNIQRSIDNIVDVLNGFHAEDQPWSTPKARPASDINGVTITSTTTVKGVKLYLVAVVTEDPEQGIRSEFYCQTSNMTTTSIQTLLGENAYDHDAIQHAINTVIEQAVGKAYKQESTEQQGELLLDEEDHQRISNQGETIEHSAQLFHDAMTEFGFEMVGEPGPGLQHKNLELYLAFRGIRTPGQNVVAMLQYQEDGSLRLGMALNSRNKTFIDFKSGKIDEGNLGHIKSAVNTLLQKEQVHEGYEESSSERYEREQQALRNGMDAVEQSIHAMFEQELVEGDSWTLNARSKEDTPHLLNLTFEHTSEPFVKLWFHCSFNEKPVYLKLSVVAYKSAKVQKTMALKIKPAGESDFTLSGEQMTNLASRVNSLIGAL
jgi:hypothetical protein